MRNERRFWCIAGVANTLAIAVVFIPCVFVSPHFAVRYDIVIVVGASVCLLVAAYYLILRSDRVAVLSWVVGGLQLGLADTAGGLLDSFQTISGPPSYDRQAELIGSFLLFVTLPVLVSGIALSLLSFIVGTHHKFRPAVRYLSASIAITIVELILLPTFVWLMLPAFFRD